MIADALTALIAFDATTAHEPYLPPPDTPLMSRDDATSCLWAIRTSTANLRALLFDLHHRKGYVALGYSTFRECIASELADMSESHVYRQLAAGVMEQQIGAPVGSLPETSIRPLGKVPPIFRRPVYEHARQDSGKDAPSPEEVEAAADRLLLECGVPLTPGEDLAQAVQRDVNAATDLARHQVVDRERQRNADRLARTLDKLRIALKGLKHLGLTLAAEHCQHAIDLATPDTPRGSSFTVVVDPSRASGLCDFAITAGVGFRCHPGTEDPQTGRRYAVAFDLSEATLERLREVTGWDLETEQERPS